MKIFLSGGSGFIGSYVLVELLKNGHTILALQRLSSIKPTITGLNLTWLSKDLVELAASDIEGVEVVIHLASTGVSPKKASWSVLNEVNISGTIHLIEQARIAGVKRFVSAGSSLEYGLEANNWINIPPDAHLNPMTPYAVSKAAGFFMLKNYA